MVCLDSSWRLRCLSPVSLPLCGNVHAQRREQLLSRSAAHFVESGLCAFLPFAGAHTFEEQHDRAGAVLSLDDRDGKHLTARCGDLRSWQPAASPCLDFFKHSGTWS